MQKADLEGRSTVPPDHILLNRVRAALSRNVDVEEKRMFGGITFMVHGKMCVSVGRDRIMCRIDPALHDTLLERPDCRTVIMKGREYRGFVYVDANALKAQPDLEYWIGLSLDYNSRGKSAPRKRQ
jgi:TfoX/Sxy family transcriptional regulator of competence genes